jgi:hypothetical protein
LFHFRGLGTANIFRMRSRVKADLTRHSHTLITLHPSLRNRREIRLSLLWFCKTLSRQKATLLFEGRLHLLHPCQKQPSTKSAIFRPGHAKSGFPTTRQCLRYPRSPALQRIAAIRRSVVLFPRDPTEAMIRERTFLVTLSTAHTYFSR